MNQSNNHEDHDLINKMIPSTGFDFNLVDEEEQSQEPKAIEQETDLLELSKNIKENLSRAKETLHGHEEKTFDLEDLFQETKNDSLKRLESKLEAILFLSDKPRTAESVAEQANADLDDVRLALSQLVQSYEERDGGIMIDCSNGYCMQIADQFEDLTEDILPIELRTAVLRTLSTIALKEPIMQSDLFKIRGGGIYEHVKELSEMGLVKKTKEGNSHILHTTKFFTENFKLSQNGLELQTVLQKATPGEVEFIRPNTLVPGHDYEEEEKNDSEDQEASDQEIN